MWKKNSQHSTLTPGKGFCSIWLSVSPKVQKNHVLARLRSPQICVELLVRPHLRLGFKCRSNPQDTVFRLFFEISTPNERFLAKISPKCPKTPKIGSPRNSPKSPEIPRNSPKFPEIPRNPPKFLDFRMVCAPHRNYEY